MKEMTRNRKTDETEAQRHDNKENRGHDTSRKKKVVNDKRDVKSNLNQYVLIKFVTF